MPLQIIDKGLCDYQSCWQEMHDYTDQRDAESTDQLWLVQHPAVFTLGLAGKPEHLLKPGDIPIVKTDRGGQVTYHGPGQVVIYVLLDIRRRGLGVRELVRLIEQAIIDLLQAENIHAVRRDGAPGVYVDGRKIAALGLRIRRGCSYHGLSLNVDMDLEPFERINPCGYPGLEVIQTRSLGLDWTVEQAMQKMSRVLFEMIKSKHSEQD